MITWRAYLQKRWEPFQGGTVNIYLKLRSKIGGYNILEGIFLGIPLYIKSVITSPLSWILIINSNEKLKWKYDQPDQ